MKTFYDLTEEEKVLLTSEQVQYYTRIDCANRGIIIPQKPINSLKEVECFLNNLGNIFCLP